MVKQFFIPPTLLGVILFIWLVLAHATGYRTTIMSYSVGTTNNKPSQIPTYVDIGFGYPEVLRVRPGRHPAVKVHWKSLLMVLAAAYVLAVPLGRWITGYRAGGGWVGPVRKGWSSPAAIVLCVIAGCALAGVTIAVILRAFADVGDVPWIEMLWGLTLIGTIVTLPVTLIVMAVRRVRWRRALTRRGFAVEMIA